MSLSNIKPIIEKRTGYGGGVENLGDFREGYCWKVNAIVEGSDVTWIMCANDLYEKETWMKTIAQTKTKFTVFTKE